MKLISIPLMLVLMLLATEGNASGLERLAVEGHLLHHSLSTPRLQERPPRHVPEDSVASNPQTSSDAEFVRVIARAGSQGNLDGKGMVAALFAVYEGEDDVGIYGLEAATEADADQREAALRRIWSKNLRLERARIHRSGQTILLVWNDGISSAVWEALNTNVSARLEQP